MKQALIVVDVQESFRRRPYFREQDLPVFLRNVQSLIDRCQSRGILPPSEISLILKVRCDLRTANRNWQNRERLRRWCCLRARGRCG